MKKVYTSLLFGLISLQVMAQWTTNTLVNTEASSTNAGTCETANTSDGKTWMAYFKSIGAPNYYEMRAQLLDKNGVKLLGPEGVLVNNAPSSSSVTVYKIAVDAADNLIVAFNTSATGNNVYVNKLNTQGVQLWGNAGITPGQGFNVVPAVLSNGDVIVSWMASTSVKGQMQKLAAATGAPQWTTPLEIAPLNAAHRTSAGHIMPIADNNYIMLFHNRATSSLNSTLWAQRYNTNGLAQWAAPVQLSTITTTYNRVYAPILSGDTVYLGYYASPNSRFDAYVQRINPDGTLPWGINGSDFATNPALWEFDIKIAKSPVSQDIWAVSRLTNSTQGPQGVYIQKFNSITGARAFTDDAKIVYPVSQTPYSVPQGLAIFDDGLPVILVGRYNSAVSQFLYANKLDANGNPLWAGAEIPLATAPVSKSRMAFTEAINNQAVAVWVEEKGALALPYAQPIRSDASTGLTVPVASFSNTVASICRNTSVQFTSTSTGYVQDYAWSFPGGTPATSTLPNPVVVYPANGTYNVSLTVSNSAGLNTVSSTNLVKVSGVAPALTLTGGSGVCLGTNTVFKASGTDLGSNPAYTWYVNGTLVPSATGSEFSFSANVAGTYYVRSMVTSNAVCALPATVSATVPVTVHPGVGVVLIAAEYQHITPGVRTALYATVSPIGNYTYQWFKNNILVAGAAGSSLPVNTDHLGEYNVLVTDGNGCETLSNKVTVSDSASKDLFIYPNPNKGKFEVRYFNAGNETLTRFINIYDARGTKVYSKEFVVAGRYGQMSVDISNQPAGTYFVELRDVSAVRIATGKVIIQK